MNMNYIVSIGSLTFCLALIGWHDYKERLHAMDKVKSPVWQEHFSNLKKELDHIQGTTPQKEDLLLVLQNRLEISIKQYLEQYDSQYKYFEPLLNELAKLKKDCRYTERAQTVRHIFNKLESSIERY